MRTIYKWELTTADRQCYLMPIDAKFLTVQFVNNKIWLYEEHTSIKIHGVDQMSERIISVIGTGQNIPVDENLKYIGTVFAWGDKLYVWHIFEQVVK